MTARHRSARRWLPALFGALVATPGQAAALDDETSFILGNALFAVYHEFGHALIDLLDLPVIGREEDAVDGFAALSMIPPAPDPTRDALIVAVADGWRLQSDAALFADARSYWSEHALDEQRHFAIVCLMVGSDQEGFFDFALDAGLPVERIETCAEDFKRMRAGWERLLNPHRPDPDAAEPVLGAPVNVVFEEPAPDQREAFALVRDGRHLERAIERLGDEILLPAPVGVRFAACGEANAYWSPDRQEIEVCYELIEDFRDVLLGGTLR